jgi:hypothetical protein
MWPKEPIPDEDHVYRHCHYTDVIKEKRLRFPNEAHFKPYSDGLSVNWDKKISLKQVFILLGLTHKPNQNVDFKDYKQFQVFKFPIKLLRGIPGIESVEHDPVFLGNPSPKGKPNNPAHTLVKYPDDEEIRMTLSDYSRENSTETYCPFDVNSLNAEIEELRLRLPDVPYNKDWIM